MCTCHPLVLLKLSVDFESQTLNFTQLLRSAPQHESFVYVDQRLTGVLMSTAFALADVVDI